jgi:hypothetical protein
MRNARRVVRALLSLSLSALLQGCTQGGIDDGGIDDGDRSGDSPDDGGSGDTGEPDDGSGDGGDDGNPSDDLVDPIGSDDAIDIAAWNIENFPANGNTPALVADLITSLDLDLVAVEEIADVDAFDELVELLPDHEATSRR